MTSSALFRLRFFAGHLLASALLLSSVLWFLYWGWYRWPAWYLEGAELVVGLMVLVDLGLGPVATLVVASPGKAMRPLCTDLLLIALVQLGALGYGAHALWVGRPLYYVYSAGQIDLVAAASVEPRDALASYAKGGYSPLNRLARSEWVWARLPEDPGELGQLLTTRLVYGEDVVNMPQYFLPIGDAKPILNKAYLEPKLLVSVGIREQELRMRLRELGCSPDSVGALPIVGRARSGTMLFDRSSTAPLAFFPAVLPRK